MSKPYFRNSVLLLLSGFLVAASTGTGPAEKLKREPIVVTSRRMEANKLEDKVTFLGDVTLKKEGITLNSDSIVVFYDTKAKNIREIEALGNVVVRKEGRVALANKASYYSREEKIVLTGDARVIENENQIGGDTITLFVRDDRSIVEGGNVLIYQDRQQEKKKGK